VNFLCGELAADIAYNLYLAIPLIMWHETAFHSPQNEWSLAACCELLNCEIGSHLAVTVQSSKDSKLITRCRQCRLVVVTS
jgi:ABC-type uncharacterized transport system permease subunit